jgi:predicted TIM-barrel fold metal-dependent hydrolase
VPEHFIVIEQRLKEMNAMAIDIWRCCRQPVLVWQDRDTAAAIVKVQNEKLAELCASQPDRFGAPRRQCGTAVRTERRLRPRTQSSQSNLPSGPKNGCGPSNVPIGT